LEKITLGAAKCFEREEFYVFAFCLANKLALYIFKTIILGITVARGSAAIYTD
jgi:hypothetical protein